MTAFDMRGPAREHSSDEPEPVPPSGRVDLDEVPRADGVLDRLDTELVGLAEVKTRVRELAALLVIDRQRARFGLARTSPNLHMCLTGNPGTGKTTVARRIAELLRELGYLRRGHLVQVTRDDLVGQYVGHTAPKTKEVLKRAMGGVLFIDEAYYLYRVENERDYGQESIEILLQVMENQRDDIVVVLAGYRDRMDEFFGANPGMRSRIAHHIEFPDYTGDELEAIGGVMLREEEYALSPEAEPVFRTVLDHLRRQPAFANARTVRNVLEVARLRHASRLLAAGGEVGRAELTTLQADDLPIPGPEPAAVVIRPDRSRAGTDGNGAAHRR